MTTSRFTRIPLWSDHAFTSGAVPPCFASILGRTSMVSRGKTIMSAEVVASSILKGWKSLSPGLRGTSYPGVGGRLNMNPERVLSKTLNRYEGEGRVDGKRASAFGLRISAFFGLRLSDFGF